MPLRRVVAALLAVLCLSAGLAGTAFAQYPPNEGTGRVDRSRVCQGELVTFEGDDFQAGSTVRITNDGAYVADVLANSSGTFSYTYRIPGNARIGQHELRGTGTGSGGNSRFVRAVIDVCEGGGGGGGGEGGGGGGGGGQTTPPPGGGSTTPPPGGGQTTPPPGGGSTTPPPGGQTTPPGQPSPIRTRGPSPTGAPGSTGTPDVPRETPEVGGDETDNGGPAGGFGPGGSESASPEVSESPVVEPTASPSGIAQPDEPGKGPLSRSLWDLLILGILLAMLVGLWLFALARRRRRNEEAPAA